MVYCNRDGVLIRDMRRDDAQAIADAEAAQGWAPNKEASISERAIIRNGGAS